MPVISAHGTKLPLLGVGGYWESCIKRGRVGTDMGK